ncbi:cyclic nucleotide-binding domain-containing protein, partial [Nostoc sp. NIES-2111]
MKSLLEACPQTPPRRIPAGTVLLNQGERTGRLYVLVSGRIEILRGDSQVAILAEPGAAVGEMSLLLDLPHTATARALGDIEVHVFEDGQAFFREHPAASYIVAVLLAQRLNAATTYLVDLKRQLAGTDNHLEMVGDVLESLLYQQLRKARPGSDRLPQSP